VSGDRVAVALPEAVLHGRVHRLPAAPRGGDPRPAGGRALAEKLSGGALAAGRSLRCPVRQSASRTFPSRLVGPIRFPCCPACGPGGARGLQTSERRHGAAPAWRTVRPFPSPGPLRTRSVVVRTRTFILAGLLAAAGVTMFAEDAQAQIFRRRAGAMRGGYG